MECFLEIALQLTDFGLQGFTPQWVEGFEWVGVLVETHGQVGHDEPQFEFLAHGRFGPEFVCEDGYEIEAALRTLQHGFGREHVGGYGDVHKAPSLQDALAQFLYHVFEQAPLVSNYFG